MKIILLVALLAIPACAEAGSFRLIVEFLYPNNSVRPVIELPNIIITPGKPSASQYSSEDELLGISRDHTLTVSLKETKESSYELSLQYKEVEKGRSEQQKHFSFDTVITLLPGKDAVSFIDSSEPDQGVFRIKIEK